MTSELVTVISQKSGQEFDPTYLRKIFKYALSQALDVKLKGEVQQLTKANKEFFKFNISHVSKKGN